MGNLKSLSIKDIHETIKKLNMKVFTQPYSVTLGAVRSSDNIDNTFNDIIFASYFNEKGKLISVIVPGTTDAGLTYRLKPMHKLGTAIIQHSRQYSGVYQYQDPKVNPKLPGHQGKEAFRQIKNMDYWRDNNKDIKLDFSGPTYSEIALTNGHIMGTLGKEVNNWSAGCWGATKLNMEQLFIFAKMQDKCGLGDKFSFIMLFEEDFKNI